MHTVGIFMANVDSYHNACTRYAQPGRDRDPACFFLACCPRGLCRLCSPRAPAAPPLLLTLLVCCVRSEDAEANDSIGGDETLHESAPVVSFAIAVTAFAATDLAFSPCDDASRSPRMLGLCSDCDCALATSFAHVSRCYLYLCRS